MFNRKDIFALNKTMIKMYGERCREGMGKEKMALTTFIETILNNKNNKTKIYK